jgi:hypothetical protein
MGDGEGNDDGPDAEHAGGGEFADIEDDDFSCDGDHGDGEYDADVADVVHGVGLDDFEQFEPDENQQEEAEQVEEFFYGEEHERGVDEFLHDGPAKVDGREYNDDGHHDGQEDGYGSFELLKQIQHRQFPFQSCFFEWSRVMQRSSYHCGGCFSRWGWLPELLDKESPVVGPK